MVVTVRSLGLTGIRGSEVTVECFLSGGLPAFDVVGLPDAAVRESRERVRAAIKACGAASGQPHHREPRPRPASARRARSTTCRSCWGS